MTLSNIFFGKKVVKQAYLNNALIYQSNGWQTLPSTCLEVWTKSYEKAGSISAIVKDDSDNFYIGAGNTVYKIDSEGNLKWKCAIQTGVDLCIITAIVVFPNYIYCSCYTNSVPRIGYMAKIDTNGDLISCKDVSKILSSLSSDYVKDMKRDKDYIYAITTSTIAKLDSNLTMIDYITISDTTTCLTTNNGPYIFVGTNSYGMRVEKSNLKNSIKLQIANSAFATTSILMDNIGNLYLGSYVDNAVYKYDVETCKLITTFSSFPVYALCTDNQENVYFTYFLSFYQLQKYSSDSTLIWNNVPIPASKNTIKVITDNNGNIYVAYIDSNSMLTIKKLINLVKEN